jgi:hypothetical protein
MDAGMAGLAPRNESMHPSPPWIATGIAFALLACPLAHAEDAPLTLDSPLRELSERELFDATALTQDDWNIGSWLLDNVHTEADHGFEVGRRATNLGDRQLIFSIQGPMMKEKTPGLALSVRF